MGFLDRAKSTIKKATKGIGEETVNVVDYDEVEEVNKQPKQRKKAAPKKKSPKVSEPLDYSNGGLSDSYDSSTVTKAHEDIPVVEETAFDIDLSETKDFISEKRSAEQGHDRHPDKKEKNQRVSDILDVLNIPITFEIESDVFLPEDLKDISFNLQAPQGYEMGEVNTFVSRVKVSTNRLVDLLKQRNEHIAKLATMVDRLQVDVNNMKFQNEVANGINVMPTSTSDSEDIENENLELRLANKRLQEELDRVVNSGQYSQNSDELSDSQREQFEILQDELSVRQREIEDLKEEIYDLKNKNAELSDAQDDLMFNNNDNEEPTDIREFAYDFEDEDDSNADEKDDDYYEVSLDVPLDAVTNLSSYGEETHIPDPGKNSAFYDDDIESTETFLQDNAEFYNVDPSENPEDNLNIFDFDDEDSNSKQNNNHLENVSYDYGTKNSEDDDDDILNDLQDWKNN